MLLHADFGEAIDLGRDEFYAWRSDDALRTALEDVLNERPPEGEELARLSALIAPKLWRLPDEEREELARNIVNAIYDAAPLVVEGGSEATRLLVNRTEAVYAHVVEAIQSGEAPDPSSTSLAQALVVGPLKQVGALEDRDECSDSRNDGMSWGPLRLGARSFAR